MNKVLKKSVEKPMYNPGKTGRAFEKAAECLKNFQSEGNDA